MRRAIWFLALTTSLSLPASETNQPPADAWFTNQFSWPSFVSPSAVVASNFSLIHAEDSAGRLKVFWAPAVMDTNAVVSVFASADAAGHWPVRDWREFAAIERGTNWEMKIPVDDVDVPIAYFASEVRAGRTNFSPLRFAYPRELGIDEPSRIFWPFIEGFEEGASSWRLAAADIGVMQLSPESKNGLAALRVTMPADRHSVAVGTTRIRGWRALHPGIRGLSVWLRANGGEARVRFGLHANAFTTNEVVLASSLEGRVTEGWQRVDVSFESFPKLPLAEVDWFTLEFIATGPREIFLDDLQFLGPWPLEPD